jgi:cytochrome c-type biogenesis protein CcmH
MTPFKAVRAFRPFAAAFVFLLALVPAVFAVQPDEVLKDPALERRARDLSSDLRCLVCQNQSIDESDAPLARDLRLLVRERLNAGDNDSQVRDFVVQRYGEFVLLHPRFATHTLLLWLTPLLAVGLGALALVLKLRNRPIAAAAALSCEEEAALAKALAEDAGPAPKG